MNRTGKLGEKLAAEYLERNGYNLLKRNWRGHGDIKCPEIDIIAEKDDAIIFVEVKTSSTVKFGAPEEWITSGKRRRLVMGAKAYLACFNMSDVECHFDAIAIDCRTDPPAIKHIKNAFLLSDVEFE